jgi:hypothetical protein
MQRLEKVEKHLAKCLAARKSCDWNSVIRESDAAVVAGADCASKVFAFKAEALLKLHRHEEADTVVSAAQKVETTLRKCRNVPADTTMLLVQSEIDMALGRSVFNLLCRSPLSSITLQKQPQLRILFKCSFAFVAFCGNPSRKRHAHIWKILTHARLCATPLHPSFLTQI